MASKEEVIIISSDSGSDSEVQPKQFTPTKKYIVNVCF